MAVSLRKIFFFFFLLSCFVPLFSHAQSACGQPNNAWQVGEKLRFKAWYNMNPLWVGAGEATFLVQHTTAFGKPAYYIAGDGRTLKSYEWFFKVRDRYQTFIDEATMLPVRFVREVNEGSIHFTELVNFDPVRKTASSPKKTIALPACFQDVISSLYNFRNIDFARYAPGSRFPLKMYFQDQIYDLSVKYLGRERIKTRYGTFNALKLSPTLIEGTVFKKGDEMTIWVSDDANHLPLRINSPLVVGSVKVDLMEYSGLRNPLASLVSKIKEED